MASKSILLKTSLGEASIKMSLIQNGAVIDSEIALYHHNLDDVLITALDKLLKRNSIDAKVLKSYKILSNLGKNSTSYKIAAAFIEGLKVRD